MVRGNRLQPKPPISFSFNDFRNNSYVGSPTTAVSVSARSTVTFDTTSYPLDLKRNYFVNPTFDQELFVAFPLVRGPVRKISINVSHGYKIEIYFH